VWLAFEGIPEYDEVDTAFGDRASTGVATRIGPYE